MILFIGIHKYFIFNENNRKRCTFFTFFVSIFMLIFFFLFFIIKLFFCSFPSRLHTLLWGTHSWLRHKHMNSYNNGRCILSFFSFFIPHNVDGMDKTNKMLLKIFLPWWCGVWVWVCFDLLSSTPKSKPYILCVQIKTRKTILC